VVATKDRVQALGNTLSVSERQWEQFKSSGKGVHDYKDLDVSIRVGEGHVQDINCDLPEGRLSYPSGCGTW
jgi:hypothetical protein